MLEDSKLLLYELHKLPDCMHDAQHADVIFAPAPILTRGQKLAQNFQIHYIGV